MSSSVAVATPDSSASRNVVNGMVIAIVSLAYALSYAALVFSGRLSAGLAFGIGASLVGSAVLGLVLSWKSGFPFAIAGPESNSMAVLAAASVAMAAEFPAGTPGPEVAVNALYLITFSGLLSGIFLLVLGTARLGRWIRYVPYPVSGGFMAGVGWLMVCGGLQVAANEPLSWDMLAQAGSGAVAWKWLAAVVWALVLRVVLGRSKHFLTLPALLVTGVLAVLLVIEATGSSVEAARLSGWVYSAPAKAVLWLPWSAADLQLLHPRVLLDHLDVLITVTLVTTLTILMNATGLEIESARDVNLERELQNHGVAQLLSALCGGFPGNVSLSRSMLNLRLGSTTRLSGLVAGLMFLLLLFIGPLLISYIPRLILAGLIIYMGAGLLWSWGVGTRKTCSWPEYLTLVLIALVIIIWGFVTGVLIGVIASCLIFAVNYGRVSVVKHTLNAAIYSSSRVRASAQGSYLKSDGDAIRIFVLQGFIFFGSADRLYRALLEHLVDTSRAVKFLILDFRFVHGIDSSALSSFHKIHDAAARRGATLVVTGVGAALAADIDSLARRGWAERRYATLDAGLEWCETELLRMCGPDEHTMTPDVLAWLAREFGSRDAARGFLAHVERREFAAGEALCLQGEVSVERSIEGGEIVRLRTLGRHTMIGEMGLYRSEVRAASVVAQHHSVVYVLTRESLERMRRDMPQLAESLCVALIKVMSERLAFANTLNSTLQA